MFNVPYPSLTSSFFRPSLPPSYLSSIPSLCQFSLRVVPENSSFGRSFASSSSYHVSRRQHFTLRKCFLCNTLYHLDASGYCRVVSCSQTLCSRYYILRPEPLCCRYMLMCLPFAVSYILPGGISVSVFLPNTYYFVMYHSDLLFMFYVAVYVNISFYQLHITIRNISVSRFRAINMLNLVYHMEQSSIW